MGFSKPAAPTSKPKPKIEPPTPLSSRFSLRDLRRNGERIIIAPANNLAASTDSFARVILIDVLKGTGVRIFKGYRDAQIGWICIDDESEEKTNKRYALYLIIYAPRRGLLEIWGCQQGIRVAAFNVGKNCKLVYPGYFMLSLNGSLCNYQLKTSPTQCFLLSSDGIIKTIHIPFHLILSDKSNQRVRDTILLKKVKSTLRERSSESDSLWEELNVLLKDFKTASMKQQALERMLITSYLSAERIGHVIAENLEEIEKQGDNLSSDASKLRQFCRFNSRLISSYIFVRGLANISEKPAEESKPDEANDYLINSLSNLMQIEENDIKSYFELKASLKKRQASFKKVKFSEPESNKCLISLAKYISFFDSSSSKTDYTKQRYFSLSNGLAASDKQTLGAFLYSSLLGNEVEFEPVLFKEFVKSVPLKKIQLLDLLVNAWLNQNYENLGNLYKYITILSGFSSYTMNSEYEPMTPVSEGKKMEGEVIKSEEMEENGDDNEEFEDVFVSDYIPKFKSSCETSNYLVESLLLCWIFRSILNQVCLFFYKNKKNLSS